MHVNLSDVCEQTDVSGLEALTLERLEIEITTLAGQISAAACQLLLAIAAYDRRGGWGVWGCRSMSHWLTWKTALSAPAARAHVRIGHALEELPLVREMFARGELSYSQVRAVTRVAVPATEAGLVELARAMTAGQLDRVLGRYRKVRAVTTETAQERWARRAMHSYLDDDGMRVTVIRQPPEEGERLVRAVDRVVDDARRARGRAEPRGRARRRSGGGPQRRRPPGGRAQRARRPGSYGERVRSGYEGATE